MHSLFPKHDFCVETYLQIISTDTAHVLYNDCSHLASFNIRKGLDVGCDMTRLAELVRQVEPDVLGLQEVEILSHRVEGRDLLRELAEAAGYPYFRHIRALDCHGGFFGSAILSRLPILEFAVTPLEVKEEDEPRAVGHAVLWAAGERIDFFCTHFSYKYEEYLHKQAAQLHALSREYPCRVLVGDYNAPDLPGVLCALEGTQMVNGGRYLTFTAPPRAIDDIVADNGWQIAERGMVEHDGRSDHNLLWAELQRVL